MKAAEYEKIIKDQQEKLELLTAALNLSKVGIYITDNEGVVLIANDAHEKITGIPHEKVLGKRSDKIENGAGENSTTMVVLKTKKPAQREQFIENGYSYFVYAEPYYDEKGEIKYVISNLIDTTEINNIKQELRKMEFDKEQLANMVEYLEKHQDLRRKLIYTSPAMQDLLDTCKKIAPFDSTALITGESGSGKEVIAEYIYANSQRTGKPFIKINCSSIPEPLLESELFGYEAGAFTSASAKGKKGLLEIADKGTVFLDEIAELPLTIQSKLLRFLQEGEIMHVGGMHPIKVDVRIIAATNKNLEKMVAKKQFRQDFYYRLNVIPIHVPPLSRRKEDIPFLIQSFLTELNEKCQLNKTMSAEVMDYLSNRSYHGNVRELKNITERLLLLSAGNSVTLSDLTLILKENVNSVPRTLQDIMEAYEKDVLQKYLAQYKTTSKMSEILHVSQPTVSRKLKRYKIKL